MMRRWIQAHPAITTTLGTAAGLAATYYGGPAAGAAAGEWLPKLCALLGFC